MRVFFVLAMCAVASSVYAAEPGSSDLIAKIKTVIVNPIIGLLFALALMFFLWGIVEFIWVAGGEEGRKKGARHILWGLIGMFIMVSVFGIINFILKRPHEDLNPGFELVAVFFSWVFVFKRKATASSRLVQAGP